MNSIRTTNANKSLWQNSIQYISICIRKTVQEISGRTIMATFMQIIWVSKRTNRIHKTILIPCNVIKYVTLFPQLFCNKFSEIHSCIMQTRISDWWTESGAVYGDHTQNTGANIGPPKERRPHTKSLVWNKALFSYSAYFKDLGSGSSKCWKTAVTILTTFLCVRWLDQSEASW